ncbi:MMPL family transporter [Shimazuella kribbensis]|uniref:MMPL family transporter n=1 Tax=Shimazuella kribbensis TaxID=139808 RepID=UPI0004296067|nr:MMPL family transporter [Shimazuella kribbensis]
MKKIISWRWPLLIIWLVMTLVLTIIQPNINDIMEERGQETVPKSSPSVVASDLLKEMSKSEGSSNLIVFYNKNGLTNTDMSNIQSAVQSLKTNQQKLGITDMLDPISTPALKDTLISKDNTTLMVNFTLHLGDRKVDDVLKQFTTELKDLDVAYYLTGESFISNDYLKASIEGVEKSAILTVLFILIVLIVMFRSVVIPLISLFTVGVSYLVSMGIAAQAIDKLNFPVTSLTQMMLVLILFGIGTDYNILLFNRFKEELAHGKTTNQAIMDTYRTAGKTILYSIATVFIAFACLSFSDFGIYKSANVVAIGTIILLLEIVTLTPFFMKVLGAKLFWPSKKISDHNDSRIIGGLASFSIKRPIITLLVIAVCLVPVFMTSGQKLSFDQIEELGDDYPSTKGFGIVADHFSRGMALPTTVVIKHKESMENNDALGVIDTITNSIKGISGVQSVRSITQPQGKPIDQFYIRTQSAEVTKGISASRDGVNSIKNGLDKMQDGLKGADFSEVNKLADGTAQLQSGYEQIAFAMNKVSSGMSSGASGAQEIQVGISKLHQGLANIASQTAKVSGGLTQIQQGYTSAQGGYDKLVGGLPSIQSTLSTMNDLIGTLGQSHSELNEDADYVKLKTMGQQLATALASTTNGFTTLQKNYKQLNSSFASTSAGLKQLVLAQNQIVNGLKELENGAVQLSKGLKQGSSGGKELAANLTKLNMALDKIQKGQVQLNTGLNKMSGGLSNLKTGLQKSSTGLGDISTGLKTTGDFLTQMGTTKTFFIPSEALQDKSFQRAADAFMSQNRTTTQLMVVLNKDPYSPEALDIIKEINEVLDNDLDGSILKGSLHGAAGPTSNTYDMNKSQLDSFKSTSVIVIVSVFLVLVLVIRAFWPAVYIIISLIASYYVGMGAVKLYTLYILGVGGVSSFVPFFAFVIIVAVGVDYSIFLMMRYKEYGELDHREAITQAAKSVGGVIISAMVILGGTFATLMPSGLILLIELAISVIVGLLVLTFIFLPMMVPACMALPGLLDNKRNK